MSQIEKKFIGDNAVDGAKIRLDNNQPLRARNAANTADIDIVKVTSADVVEVQKLLQAAASLPIPSQPKEYVTVEFIENFVNGKIDAKDSANVLSITNVPLTGSTPLVIDDITVTNGMRLGLIGQTAASANGLYKITITGATYALARTTDANADDEVNTGMFFKVVSGTLYAGYECILTTDDPITLGTTALTFIKQPSALTLTAGDMLQRVGNDFSVDISSTGGLESTNSGNAAGQLKARTDQSSLEKDKTTKIDSGTNAIVAKKSRKQSFTLSGTDVTNQYIDLDSVASESSIQFNVKGGGAQIESDDYTVNYTGGASSKTRITFAGGLATAGVSALVSGDIVVVTYTSF
jgi:hypothetical protein